MHELVEDYLVHWYPCCASRLLHVAVCFLLAYSATHHCLHLSPPDTWHMQVAEKKKLLLKYVKDVQPALIEQFVDQGPPAVVAAMRNTITNMVRGCVYVHFSVSW